MEAKKMIWGIIVFIIISALLAGVGQVFVKKGLNEIGPMDLAGIFKNFFKIATNLNIVLGLSMYAVATIFFFVALSQGSLNLVFPLVSLSYVFAALVSIFVLKDIISPLRWLGILVIMAGCVLVGLG